MDTNTVQVINEFGSKLDSYMSVMATKIGVATDHFYPVVVQQQQIDGYIGIGQLVISMTIFLISIRRFTSSLSDNKDEKQISDRNLFKVIASFVFGIVFGILTLTNLMDFKNNVGMVYNPEFYAFKQLVTMVK